MNRDLELVKKYPSLLEKYGEKMGGLTSLWCDDGWYSLVDEFLQQCAFMAESFNYDIKINQVKEKFGRLRIYWDFKTGHPLDRKERLVREIVNACAMRIEDISQNVCEITGESGTLCKSLSNGRFKTLSYRATRENETYKDFYPISNSVSEYWNELDKQKND